MERKGELEEILKESGTIQGILEKALSLGLPDWYLGAGIIAQTVWNKKHGFDLNFGIKDADLVYFDSDLSQEKAATFVRKGENVFEEIAIPVEIINEARVHLWYEREFGYNIDPYTSVEAAIDTWPTTATAVGIKIDGNDNLFIYAPFGIRDLLDMIVRPNKKQITQEIYAKKVNRWKKAWPNLQVVSWDQ
jgi:uncharacterized protein